MLGTFSDHWSLIFAWIPRVISMVIWKVSSKCAKTWFSWYSSDRLKSSTGIIRWFFLYLRLENMQCFCRVSILSQEILAKPQDIGAYGYKYKQYGFVYTYMYITTYILVYIHTYMLQTRVQTFVFQTKPVWKLMLLFTWMRWRHKICQTINLISRYLTRFNKSAHVEETPRTVTMFVYQNIQIDWLVSKQIASRFESRRLNSCKYFWNVELAICWRIIPLRRLVAHCLAAFTKKPVSKYKQVSEFTQVVRGYWNQVAPKWMVKQRKPISHCQKINAFHF